MTLAIQQGDLFKIGKDGAIVNPANENLQHGGGIARAIADKAGKSLQTYSTDLVKKQGPIAVGEVTSTPSYQLEKSHQISIVIHAVGPHGTDKDRKEKLEAVHRKIIRFCAQHKIKKVAIPAISTGIFGYDAKDAAPIAVKALIDELKKTNTLYPLEVIIVVPEKDKLGHYETALTNQKQ